MNAIEAMKGALNVTRTENGDIAYKSTGLACLDFFSLCGGMRGNIKDLERLFIKAYNEDPIIAVKTLFYMRNIRGGLGERESFRSLLKDLALLYPKTAEKVIYAVSVYGRWDDLLCLLKTPVKKRVIALIKEQLEKDKCALQEGKCVSLLGKWLPSVNASSKNSGVCANILMKSFSLKAVEYRKLCTALRKEIKIIENSLRQKDYSFDYEKQPSQALFHYRKAFLRNDKERYKDFLKKAILEAKKTSLNTKTLYPYQITAPFIDYHSWGVNILSEEEKLPLEASWQSLDRSSFDSKTIVVRDGSGSMYHNTSLSPINIANSLTLLFAEELKGEYKNSFITFSSEPELVVIPEICDTLEKKIIYMSQFGSCLNTDIAKVFELILQIAKNNSVPKEDMIGRVLIISDMEFDSCVSGLSTFENYKSDFATFGYKMPEVVFWNVEARSTHFPVTKNEVGVKLVSGASASIFRDVVSGDLKEVTPYNFMLKVLEPYSEFESLLINA